MAKIRLSTQIHDMTVDVALNSIVWEECTSVIVYCHCWRSDTSQRCQLEQSGIFVDQRSAARTIYSGRGAKLLLRRSRQFNKLTNVMEAILDGSTDARNDWQCSDTRYLKSRQNRDRTLLSLNPLQECRRTSSKRRGE